MDSTPPSAPTDLVSAPPRKRTAPRSRTILARRMSRREVAIAGLQNPTPKHWRPSVRGECLCVERPCPFVSCQFNLYLDVSPKTGSIKLNFPNLEPDEMSTSCALDVADQGGVRLDDVAQAMNITRERARQLEERALHKLAFYDRVLGRESGTE